MAEHITNQESDEKIAKEITIRAMEKWETGPNKSAESIGEGAGKLYKLILKSVREAINDKKYN